MITHKNDLGNEKNPDRYAKITAVGSSMSSDGLSSLSFWVNICLSSVLLKYFSNYVFNSVYN